MKIQEIVLIIICAITVFTLIKSIFRFSINREAAKRLYQNLTDRADGDSLYKMAVISLLLFKHERAIILFQKVYKMLQDDSFKPKVFESNFLEFNMCYCVSPLPWIKEPKDINCNFFNHILFRIFGRYHSPYYKGIADDLNGEIYSIRHRDSTMYSKLIFRLTLLFLFLALSLFIVFRNASSIHENKTILLSKLDSIEIELKDYKEPILDLKKIIESDPVNEKTYNSIGVAKYNSGDYRGAIKTIDQGPQTLLPIVFRALAKQAIDDNEGAIIDWTTVIENNHIDVNGNIITGMFFEEYAPLPKWAMIEAYYRRGMANYKIGKKIKDDFKFEEKINAFRDFSLSIKWDSTISKAYLGRAFVLFALDNANLACLDLKKASELGDEKAKQMISKFCK